MKKTKTHPILRPESADATVLLRKVLAAISVALAAVTLSAQAAQGPQPSICTRACWGARNGTCTTMMTSLTRAIIHHTAGPGDFTTDYETAKSKVRGVQNLHMDSKGWCDIAYHFMVSNGGHIFEGREGAMTSLIKGSHAGCGNVNSFGFTFLGYFHTPYNHVPSAAMQDAMYDVIAWRMPSTWSPYGARTTYSGSLYGTAAPLDTHSWVGASTGSGCAGTACPGDIIINNYITSNFTGGPMRDGINSRKSGGGGGGGSYNPGVVRGRTFMLRNSLSSGDATTTFDYGATTDTFVMGDWDGNGSITPGAVRNESGQLVWYLRNSNSGGEADITLTYGVAGDLPLAGNWDGIGGWSVGVVRGNVWYLRNSNTSGPHDITFGYGTGGDIFITGDWDGNGTFTPGIVRGSNTWMLRNANTSGSAEITFSYGTTGDLPMVGDWDNNGSTTCGVVRGNTWMLRNANSGGTANITFGYGSGGDKFIVWR